MSLAQPDFGLFDGPIPPATSSDNNSSRLADWPREALSDVFVFESTLEDTDTSGPQSRGFEVIEVSALSGQEISQIVISISAGFGRDVTTFDFDPSGAKGGNGKGGGGGNGGGPPGGGGDDGDGGGGGDGLLSSYTSGGNASTSFNIEIEFSGTWTAALQDAFIEAADYISGIILGDITNVRGRFATDDITISASLVDIDGTGGILGRAGPTAYRTASYLPAAGIMEFDIADAETYDALGLFNDIVFHEMMHTLGFGTMWDLMGLTSGTVEGGDIVFTGSNAIAEFEKLLGLSAGTATGVPIETDGGPGTAGGHWDETEFVNEIMTGYINNVNYLSMMSVAALEDMGYDTVYNDPNDANDLFGTMPTTTIFDDTVAV